MELVRQRSRRRQQWEMAWARGQTSSSLVPANNRDPEGCVRSHQLVTAPPQLSTGPSIPSVPQGHPQAPSAGTSQGLALSGVDLGSYLAPLLLKYLPGGRNRGQVTGWCDSAPLKSKEMSACSWRTDELQAAGRGTPLSFRSGPQNIRKQGERKRG